jgi:uroporphyrin-III C-methyltransferase
MIGEAFAARGGVKAKDAARSVAGGILVAA